MFQRILSYFQKTFYIQIWEKRIKVTDVDTGNCFDEKPYLAIETKSDGAKIVKAVGNSADMGNSSTIKVVNPFSHPRCLFSDFYVAEKVLQHVIKTLHGKAFVSASPKIIIHPMEKIEGGLTMIEKRAFRELGHGAGAMEVVIYTGVEIAIDRLDYDSVKAQDEDFNGNLNKPRSNIGIIIFFVIVAITIVVIGN
ncbi:rod shape-determining protein MreB [Shewanella psychropiezotolerans]|uniref:Rod shape-determining protein MreB n=1 Tax=Shewanella psychropiezotolerans TaxID=2593655 RepID=A0ABX5WYA3_9GAMM|nr:rod shape-determining protein [Shewanella psychropiezotolerans]QDO83748.1 rod shape-determining protein MreB [Shewanella psychropiezotolerans]